MCSVRPTYRLLLLILFFFTLFAAAAPDSGQPMPEFSATTLDGSNYSNGSLSGSVVLIQFWATWCHYCIADQPYVDQIDEEYSGRGLVTLAVDVGESKSAVENYLQRSPRSVRVVLMKDTDLVSMFRPSTFPTYVVVDREGRIAATHRGSAGEAGLRRLVRHGGL